MPTANTGFALCSIVQIQKEMKNNYTYSTVIIILLSAFSSFSQVNNYFQYNPEWHIRFSFSDQNCSGNEDSYNYFTNGDTILGSWSYKKIYKKGLTSDFVSCQPINTTPYSNTTASFYLRSFGKKMFLFNSGDTIEKLLYDFNLFVGDTLPETYTYNPGNSIGVTTVTAIDSIYTPFGYRKRFALSVGNTYLYEGIGSSGGLTEPTSPFPSAQSWELLCFSLNDTGYVPSLGPSCDLGVGIQSFEIEKPLSVFPNPFSENTKFQFNREIKKASLKIFNIRGTKVKNIDFSGTNIIFNRGVLNSGLYYYQIEIEKENILTGKLIIID